LGAPWRRLPIGQPITVSKSAQVDVADDDDVQFLTGRYFDDRAGESAPASPTSPSPPRRLRPWR